MKTPASLLRAPARQGLALLALGALACDPEVDALDELDPPSVDFRNGDGTWGPGKLNTNFLGVDSTFPVDAIPLVYDPKAPVRLHAIWTKRCRTTGGVLINDGSLYYTSDIDGDLSLKVEGGALKPAIFRKYGNPAVTCIVAGSDWVQTVWGIIVNDAQGTPKNRYMMLLDRTTDERGQPVHKWGFLDGPDPFVPSWYKPTCAEDQDPFGNAFFYRFHSYLVDDLHVDPTTGDFTDTPATLFLACRSGAVGKSIQWGYSPWKWGSELHELATRVVRADYCGDGTSFTQKGNALQLRDELGVNAFDDLTFTDEAAWSLGVGRATCVTLPRHHPLREGFTAIECGGQPLPACTASMMANGTIATKVAD